MIAFIDYEKLVIPAMLLFGLLIGITVHEFAHAWSAALLGDCYAKRQGRVSLNPLRHLSPLGTLAVFILRFGWGKPVPVNLYNFKHPRRDYLLTSLAGPAANLIVLGLCIALMQLTRRTYWFPQNLQPASMIIHMTLEFTALINALLAVINLIPIPPLDGSKIWPCLLSTYKPAQKRKTTWLFIIALVILVYSGGLKPVLGTVVGNVMRIMPVCDGLKKVEEPEPSTSSNMNEISGIMPPGGGNLRIALRITKN